MPLDDARLLAMKDGVVELTATVRTPERDTAGSFGAAVQQLVLDHQYQIMTDPAILAGDRLQVGTVVESRDPLPEPLHDALAVLGFSPLTTETGGAASAVRFSRFQKRQRSKLDRWRTVYQRAADVSERLARLEDCLMEEIPDGEWFEVAAEASDALIRGARTHLEVFLSPGCTGVGTLEHTPSSKNRPSHAGGSFFHPALVRGLAGFLAETFMTEAPQTVWSSDPEDDGPLWVRSGEGPSVRTDPEFRVIQFVARGRRASLDQYVRAVLAQTGEH